jgi:hypothetical protein
MNKQQCSSVATTSRSLLFSQNYIGLEQTYVYVKTIQALITIITCRQIALLLTTSIATAIQPSIL